MLETKIMSRLFDPVLLSEILIANPRELTELVRSNGLEGLIAKHTDSVYESGKRSGRWVKLRVNQSQEFVIGGYVPLSGSFDSIAVGYYDDDDLICVARVRNGFVPESRATVFKLFHKLEIKECPFANLPEPRKGRWGEEFTADDMAKCRWLRPQLVVQVEFAEWTPTNHLRHSKFIAVRDDKEPKEVHRERV
jgi:bifunctional non-homologous end joining protein LigD